MLNIEHDKGTLNVLAIENKPSAYPSLFDLKTPHSGENLGLFSKKNNKQKKTLDLDNFIGSTNSKNDITFKFKEQDKEDRKKMIQEEKFRAINTFLPRTNVFSKLS